MIFYLTAPDYNALRRTSVPLFVNRAAFFGGGRGIQPFREGVKKMTPRHRRALQKYRAKGEWCLDSGGYTALSNVRNNGLWPITAEQYVEEVRFLREHVGGMRWAAAMDWMTEDPVLKHTQKHWDVNLTWVGGRVVDDEESDELVRIHQELTVDNYLELRRLGGRELEHVWLPVIQGRNLEQYDRHVRMYLIHGIDLRQVDWVGVGSVCRMGREDRIADVFAHLSSMGLYRLHGFGLKKQALPAEQDETVTTERDLRELYRVAAEAGMDPYDLQVRLPGILDQTAWDQAPTQVCHMIRSADSNAWGDRARKYTNDVNMARDREFGEGAWIEEAGVIYSKLGPLKKNERASQKGWPRLGLVDPNLARMPRPTWNAPTQILRECAVLIAAGQNAHFGTGKAASCNFCLAWAHQWRNELRELLEPLGCWDEAPPFRTLPVSPYMPPEQRAADVVARLASFGVWPPPSMEELKRRFPEGLPEGPPPPPPPVGPTGRPPATGPLGPQLTLWNPRRNPWP